MLGSERKSRTFALANKERRTLQAKAKSRRRDLQAYKHRGVEQLVARQAHNLEVVRSSRASATKQRGKQHESAFPSFRLSIPHSGRYILPAFPISYAIPIRIARTHPHIRLHTSVLDTPAPPISHSAIFPPHSSLTRPCGYPLTPYSKEKASVARCGQPRLLCVASDPVGIQTQDLQNRNLTLYSAKLRGRRALTRRKVRKKGGKARRGGFLFLPRREDAAFRELRRPAHAFQIPANRAVSYAVRVQKAVLHKAGNISSARIVPAIRVRNGFSFARQSPVPF